MRKIASVLPFILIPGLLGYTVAASADQQKLQAPLFNNLSSFHHPISTKVPMAQRFFDQGFVLFYGFEWGESIRSFKEATRLDPQCAMCYWGHALALGYKINSPVTGNEYTEAKTAIDKAVTLAATATPAEQDYIKALALRFEHPPKTTKKAGAFSCHSSNSDNDESSQKEILAYVNAMKNVVATYPQDGAAKALYGAALFWSKSSVETTAAILKTAIAEDATNIGANHYFIHITEPYTNPEAALDSANLFRTLVPGSEHLVHMPAHIYFLTGRYHEATNSNLQAIDIYKKYNEACYAQGFEPEKYYLYFHNYDFLRTSASMEGREKIALTAARQLVAAPFPAWLANETSLQWFIPIPYFVELRFGKWNEALNEPSPEPKYQYALGMWHYAHGMARVHTGDAELAKPQLLQLQRIIAKGNVESNLGESGLHLLTIAREILTATIADSKSDAKSTIAHLKLAAGIQHAMGYHEPPDWYFPVQEILGNAYLKYDQPREAIASFQRDLMQYPRNGWALYGMASALRKVGKAPEATQLEHEFKTAWQYADIATPVNIFKK